MHRLSVPLCGPTAAAPTPRRTPPLRARRQRVAAGRAGVGAVGPLAVALSAGLGLCAALLAPSLVAAMAPAATTPGAEAAPLATSTPGATTTPAPLASPQAALARPTQWIAHLLGPPEAVAIAKQALSAQPAGSLARAASSEDAARAVYAGLREAGYLWARVGVAAQGDTLRLEPGPRARIAALHVEGADSLLARDFVRGAELMAGVDFRPGRWAEQLARGLRALAERGHPFANVSIRDLASDERAGAVSLTLWLYCGPSAAVSSVTVLGATHTRPDVLQRMTGIKPGGRFRESMLEAAAGRLLAREVVVAVDEIAPVAHDGAGAQVDLRVRVQQAPTTGRVSAALGLVREAQQAGTKLTGSVDLALLDLFGTARQLRTSWLDNAAGRRRLDISYLEPLLLGMPLDLRMAIGQRHQQNVFDTVLGDLGLRLPWTGRLNLELGAGADRTTFEGAGARTRSRQRLNALVGLTGRRGPAGGAYGSLSTRLEGARVRESASSAPLDPSAPTSAFSESQTMVDARASLGYALAARWALEARGTWQSTAGERLPLPPSEQWYVGGATTVRGYREEQFHGERVAYGGGELVVGAVRGSQGYAFYDLGWVRETADAVPAGLFTRDRWLHGFGLGMRVTSRAGRIDLSVGFSGSVSFDTGKAHIALTQDF
jgi:hypothetical protein